MKTHYRFALLSSLFASAACGPATTPGTDAATGTDVAPMDVNTADTGAGDASATCVLSDAGDASSGYYVPAGYVFTPFLADSPTYTFDQADTVIDPCKHYEAVIETDVGRVVLDFYDAQTPITTNSFVFLARNHFYDGQAFHRVIAGFVAQGGDPNTLGTNRAMWGTGGPGYMFGLEAVPSLTYDGAGVVGMARGSDPGSNGSQFFITLAAAHSLDTMYTIFARVTEGGDVPAMMAQGEPPTTPTRMQRVYIVERAR